MPTNPGPTNPGPTNPGPTNPGPTDPGPTDPGQPIAQATVDAPPGDREPTRPGPDKLSLIVFSGTFTKVHYALVLASAAAAVGTPATLFFTMGAAAFLAAPLADGTPGWRPMAAAAGAEAAALADGRGDAGALDAGALDDRYRDRGVATFDELLTACAELGVRFIVCEMGLRAMDIPRSALRRDIPIEESGVVTFLADASPTGTTLFI